MDSSFFLTTVAAAFGIITLFRNIRFHRDDDKEKNSSSSSSSDPSCSSSSSVSPSSVSHIWKHHVFPSFRGEDVRRDFLSHIQMEFQRMGITPFIDNEIKRGEFIGPELIQAIRGSKIAIVLLSRNYASSSWCLDELAEIMKCREELGQTVLAVFYKVDPSDVKKLTGAFGDVFRKTCAGKTKEVIGRWRQALAKVATIAGYHSNNWDNEAAMIRKIATDISDMLNYSVLSSDFDGLIGMRAHLEMIEPLLCPGSDEVRMIGIWGPPGIGKTTIARVAYHQLSNSFQLCVFMENISENYTRPSSDDYSVKLHLQQQLMSRITNQKDMEISHLGAAQDRLKDKKVLVVLDGVDHLIQLDAMAKETRWFGPGSRIIVTTQDHKLFRAHGIIHIYNVDLPAFEEALQIFCMYAFGQKFPKDGFKQLAWEITGLVGRLPLGLRVMGSYFRGMSKQEWRNSLPKLRSCINTEISSILKFSYDALDDEEKDLFLHLTCFFNFARIEEVEEHLAEKFLDVRQGLNILADKSLIFFEIGRIIIHNLLVQLGKDIVRKQSVREPRQRQFLVDKRDICEVLTDNAAGSSSVIGIDFSFSSDDEKLDVSERSFEGMPNLQFIRFYEDGCKLHLSRGLDYLSRKLQLLHWDYFHMTSLSCIVNSKVLVEVSLRHSKLEMLWEGIKSLRNLKWMDLSSSKNLKQLPDLSTATNLQRLCLSECDSLAELPTTIGYAINLEELILIRCVSLINLPSSIANAISLKEIDLRGCSSLVEFPYISNATKLKRLSLSGCSSLVEIPFSIGDVTDLQELDLSKLSCKVELPAWIGNATNLTQLDLSECSSLVELPVSVGNLLKLEVLVLSGCSKLEILPTNINLESLNELDLRGCASLKSFPEISENIRTLNLIETGIKEVPLSIRSWSRLQNLHLPYIENLKEFPQVFDSIRELYFHDTGIQEIHPWVKSISRLHHVVLKGCRKLVSLPQFSDSLSSIDAEDCESLERLDCFFHNPKYLLIFAKCFKLNQEARDLIIQTPTSGYAVLPGREVPAYFTHRATGGSMTINLNERPLPSFMRFKACILLDKLGDDEEEIIGSITVKCGKTDQFLYPPIITEHLYIFEVETEVTSTELFLEFTLDRNDWKIKECGVLQLLEVSSRL